MSETLSNLDAARAASLGEDDFNPVIVEWKGARYGVRPLTPVEMERAEQWAKVKRNTLDEKGATKQALEVDKYRFGVAAMVFATYDPDSGKSIWATDTKADFDRLISRRGTGLMLALNDAYAKVSKTHSLNEARGNSSGEESSGSSTASQLSPDA